MDGEKQEATGTHDRKEGGMVHRGDEDSQHILGDPYYTGTPGEPQDTGRPGEPQDTGRPGKPQDTGTPGEPQDTGRRTVQYTGRRTPQYTGRPGEPSFTGWMTQWGLGGSAVPMVVVCISLSVDRLINIIWGRGL